MLELGPVFIARQSMCPPLWMLLRLCLPHLPGVRSVQLAYPQCAGRAWHSACQYFLGCIQMRRCPELESIRCRSNPLTGLEGPFSPEATRHTNQLDFGAELACLTSCGEQAGAVKAVKTFQAV